MGTLLSYVYNNTDEFNFIDRDKIGIIGAMELEVATLKNLMKRIKKILSKLNKIMKYKRLIKVIIIL